jgi:hypothetical protein
MNLFCSALEFLEKFLFETRFKGFLFHLAETIVIVRISNRIRSISAVKDSANFDIMGRIAVRGGGINEWDMQREGREEREEREEREVHELVVEPGREMRENEKARGVSAVSQRIYLSLRIFDEGFEMMRERYLRLEGVIG